MRQVIVFDFDDTLSTFDTIYPFLLFCNKDNYLFLTIKKILWILSKGFLRIQILSNDQLKQIGIFLFIYKYPKDYILKKSEYFFKEITYHQGVLDELNKYLVNCSVYISSASFSEYLIFFAEKYNPVILLSSKIKYIDNKVFGLEFNNFSENKALFFLENNIEIDILYTDSYSDKSLAKISKKIMLVHADGKLLEINSYLDFVKILKSK